jgi:hypothetical protein
MELVHIVMKTSKPQYHLQVGEPGKLEDNSVEDQRPKNSVL